jgi:hypothetical protein
VMTVTTTSPATAGLIPFPNALSSAASPPLPFELLPFRRGSLPAAEAGRLLEQGLVRLVIADVLVAIDAPDSREIRAAAAALLIPDQVRADLGWVVGFDSAAWLHTGFGPGQPASAELQVIITPGRRRPTSPVVRGRQVALGADQIGFLGGIAVTDPVRTAADVARDLPTVQALSALRRLGELAGVRPHQVIQVLAAMRYARGAATARQLVKKWAEEG